MGSQIPSLVLNTFANNRRINRLCAHLANPVLLENKELASEETESPGLDSDVEPGFFPVETVEDFTITLPLREELKNFPHPDHYNSAEEYYGEVYRNAKKWRLPLRDGTLQSKWHKENWDKISIGGENFENEMVKNEGINFDHFINLLYLEREPRFSMEEIGSLGDPRLDQKTSNED